MKNLLYLTFSCILLLCACTRPDTSSLLRQADAVVFSRPDSAMTLLSQIESPGRLPYEEKMLYGWLRAYVHRAWGSSMIEDTLILPAFDYYKSGNDTLRKLNSYLLKSQYLHWQKKYEEAIAVLDSGIVEAIASRDTLLMTFMYSNRANWYVYALKDYERAIDSFRKAIALMEDSGLYFSQGIAMGLQGNDSSHYYMNRSIQLALQNRDTARAAHYLRNYSQLLVYSKSDYPQAIDVVKRLNTITKNEEQISMGYLVLTECFLKMGQPDSARYYLDKGKANIARYPKFLTTENMINLYQALIDYTDNRTFDILHTMRYNDSLHNALYALQSTVVQKDESKESLSNDNLKLTVERQETQLTLLVVVLVLVLAGGGVFIYIRNRRNRLIEAEERIETLNRLLADATQSTDAAEDSGVPAAGVEDGHFFRRILLQQLGIIRLVATQPTSQNQELLRRMSGITNRELPVESLLVWEDLYPVIDRIYDGFYTKMHQRFGTLLIDKEQQLCCLLCAEFSTKEISVVTQQSIPTIYQRKTNIRKKLGMGEKEDIVGYILGS